MAEDREKITTGPNDRAVNEPIAGTAPGIPDEARRDPDEPLPEPPSDDEVRRTARNMGAPDAKKGG